MNLLEYVLKKGAEAKLIAISAPTKDQVSVNNCFEKVFQHEADNTKAICKIVKMSFEEEDWASWNFMQWFVKDQIEEENLAISLLGKIKMAGGEKATSNALYELNKDLQTNPDDANLPQDVTTADS